MLMQNKIIFIWVSAIFCQASESIRAP